ncbi:MAG TPA: C_GCAxxG_C_C family protein [Gammaproteobacteria bacterium]|nr:C_GCAxxG_C_C family protein [Gammaproteobacteria bacterium]
MGVNEKSAMAEKAYELAFNYELEYGCCPQCVLTTVKETIGYVTDDTIKASHGLSGGGGLTGVGACGALTGGLMALSCKRGRERDDFAKGKYITNFKHGQKLIERFKTEFGGVTCQELQQQFTGKTFDLWNAKEYAQFDKEREHQCAHASAMVSKWVVELL